MASPATSTVPIVSAHFRSLQRTVVGTRQLLLEIERGIDESCVNVWSTIDRTQVEIQRQHAVTTTITVIITVIVIIIINT